MEILKSDKSCIFNPEIRNLKLEMQRCGVIDRDGRFSLILRGSAGTDRAYSRTI
jgi:hypothetical protein